MKRLGIAEGKDRFSEIVEQASQGQTILITRNGKAMAELRPVAAGRAAEVVAQIIALDWTLGTPLVDLIGEGREERR